MVFYLRTADDSVSKKCCAFYILRHVWRFLPEVGANIKLNLRLEVLTVSKLRDTLTLQVTGAK